MHTALVLLTAILRASIRHPFLALTALVVIGALTAPLMGPATDMLWKAIVLVGISLVVMKFVFGGGRRR